MKKAIWFVLGCLLIGGAAFGQSFTITSPNGGESWELGKLHNITWTYPGIPNNKKVKLMLWKDGSKVGDIATDLPIGSSGSGSYAWTVGSYQGGTAEDGTGYKVRVRDMQNQYEMDQSNQPFAIAPASEPPSKPGKLKAQVGQVAEAMVAISIKEPTKTSVWTIGETHTIRWSAADRVKYPLWLFLVSADHTIPIVDIGKVQATGQTRPMEKMWTVTDNLYDGQYCIRITSADRAYEQHSVPFTIKASKTTTYEVLPSAVYNKVQWHNIVGGDIWPGEVFHGGTSSIPDPGGKIIKYGWQRWYDEADTNGYTLHHSYVFFDLAGVISKLVGPATVKSASIHWEKAANSPQACFSVIWALDGAMAVGDGSNMFGAAFDAFPKHKVNGSSQLQMQIAQRWLTDPAKNYGVVICSSMEGVVGQNAQCVEFGDQVVLKLTIEEKLNK